MNNIKPSVEMDKHVRYISNWYGDKDVIRKIVNIYRATINDGGSCDTIPMAEGYANEGVCVLIFSAEAQQRFEAAVAEAFNINAA